MGKLHDHEGVRVREEERIRDHLASHLDLIEEGLRLVKVEYKLPNALGSKGFIDILAKDAIGHLVVIEIKRSDKTAREAIHEFFKYTSLLLQNEGVGADRVRAVLVSTHWHELRVPFSSFARSAPFSVHGLMLELDQAGLPVASQRVVLDEVGAPRRFSPHHAVHLYTTSERRSSSMPGLVRALAAVPIHDYVVLALDYTGDDPRVVFTSALYVAMDRLSEATRSLLAAQAQPSAELFDAENDSWWMENWALSQLSSHGHERDDFEVGYSQKLAAMVQNDWQLREVTRGGKAERARATLSDEEILTELQGFAGENHDLFMRAGTPDVGPSWRALRESLSSFLESNESWRAAYETLLNEVERHHPDARVVVRVYDQDPLIGFTHLIEGTAEYLPDAELIAHSQASGTTIQGYGFLDWDGTPPPPSARAAYDQVLKLGSFGILLGSAAEDFLALHGLRYGFGRRTIQNGVASVPSYIEQVDGEWRFVERQGVVPLGSLKAFVDQHSDYLSELVACFRTVYRDLPGPP